jgi:hypothetical protein
MSDRPTDSDGARLCDWCGDPIPEPAKIGRPRDYCRRSCRQRAYEERKVVARIEEREKLARISALAQAASLSSRAEKDPDPVSPRDESGPPAPAATPPPALPPRRGTRRRSTMTASPMPLWTDPGEPDGPATTKPR